MTSKSKHIVVLGVVWLALLCSGCDYSGEYYAAECEKHAFIEVANTVEGWHYDSRLLDVEVRLVEDKAKLNEICQGEFPGCDMWGVIFIDPKVERAAILAHELSHEAQRMIDRAIDYDHADEFWWKQFLPLAVERVRNECSSNDGAR